jgi:hypothetical protein
MALLPSIRIDIASGFNDKGFKKASRSATLLTRQFRQLGGTVAAALSVQAIIRYSRESVKAFAEEDAAVTKLTKTFNNLGLSFEAATANDYISQLQKSVAVTDDELRPALETLIRTTLDLEQAQKILGVALDVSAGTGYDLQKVTSALSKAYLGQGTALGKLNIGIGKSEASTISFNDALSRLEGRFGGQAAAAVDTYAGKLKLLSIAGEEARESIGQRMLFSLELLAKDQTIEGLTSDMEDFADKIGLATVGLASMLGQLNRKITIGGRSLGEILFAAAGGGFIDALAKKGAEVEYGVKQRTLGAPGAMQRQAADKQRLAQEKANLERIIALEKKRTAEQIKQKRLREISKMLTEKESKFDLQRIQLAAAAQGKLTEEERKRLAEMQIIENLKDAIATDDLTRAEELLKQLNTLQEASSKLATTLIEFPMANDPFTEWGKTLNGVIGQLTAIAQKKIVVDFLANFQFAPILFPSTSSTAAAVAAATSPAANAASSAASAAANEAAGDAYAEIAKAQAAAAAAAEAAAAAAAAIAAAKSQAEKIAAEEAARAAAAAAAAAAVQEEAAAALLAAAAAQEAANAAAEAAQAQNVAELLASDAAAQAAANALTEASFTFEESVMGAFAAGTPVNNIYVTVEGSVTAVEDLAATITDIQYNYQRSGTNLRFSSIAI